MLRRSARLQARATAVRADRFNLADLLPPEIWREILINSDELTQHLNDFSDNSHRNKEHLDQNETTDGCQVSRNRCIAIWRCAFQIEWPGDLLSLPSSHLPNHETGLLLVRSRAMYQRLFDCSVLQLGKYAILSSDHGRRRRHIQVFKYGDLVHTAIYNRWLDLADEYPWEECREEAVQKGAHLDYYLDECSHLFDQGDGKEACLREIQYNAARLGYMDIVKRVGCDWDDDTWFELSERLITTGNLDVVKWMHEVCSKDLREDAMPIAANMGYLHIVQYLYANISMENALENWHRVSLVMAVSKGHLEVSKWLYTQIQMDSDDAFSIPLIAAIKGKLDFVQYFNSTTKHSSLTRDWRELAMYLAALNGHLHIIHFLRTELPQFRAGGRCLVKLLGLASSHDHLDIVQALLDPWNEDLALQGLKYAVAAGCTNIICWLLDRLPSRKVMEAVRHPSAAADLVRHLQSINAELTAEINQFF
jgi:hypothetical protein